MQSADCHRGHRAARHAAARQVGEAVGLACVDRHIFFITPLMVYFPLILIFCQRWQSNFGLGSLAATMLPYSVGLLVSGLAMTIAWVVLDLPLGPGASVFMEIPTTVR